MSENKVTFGLKNAHYAKVIFGTDGSITYGEVKPLPGSTELTTDPRGDMTSFYADDLEYYSADNNQGYDGKLTLAEITEDFRIDILGEVKDEDDGVITENATAKGSYFALMFEFDGDAKAVRHVHYYCKASRPSVGSSTKTDSVDPNTTELDFVSSPRPTDYKVKAKTSSTITSEVYNNWYNAVYEKVTDPLTVTVSPVDAATGVAVNSNVVWTFSKALNEANVNAGNFIIMNATGTEIAGTLTLDETKKIVTFNPTSDLSTNTAYTAIALKTVRGADSSAMVANSITNFTTVTS
ncbi:major tail protein [Clostridium beijerinckii]|uniref:major tail protein n=1 Tax=Clostridium beijerinckii TaxID=1520 RepID=UPI00232EF503|nr:major tail protein [Clostridium beijerinckii]